MSAGRKISLQTIEESVSHAIVKARGDVNKIIQTCGYVPLIFGSTSPIGLWRVLVRHYDIRSLIWKIKRDDTVFIQFPWIHNNKKEFYQNLFGSGARVECIIHDLDSFRYADQEQHSDELLQLNRCSSIIAHTPAMKEYLVQRGINAAKIKVIYLFPYLTSDAMHVLEEGCKDTVIFAGNLAKSPFIKHLHEIASDNFLFNLYGKGAEDFTDSDFVKHKGMFEPDHPGAIEGNWGLVWDGADLDTCSGTYGSYLRYNSSHKISLYLSLGIPVILWSESSLKGFITCNHLGITVDSLRNLKAAITAISPEQRKQINESVRKFAPYLRNGDILRNLINK